MVCVIRRCEMSKIESEDGTQAFFAIQKHESEGEYSEYTQQCTPLLLLTEYAIRSRE
jgi:hypothetical protein